MTVAIAMAVTASITIVMTIPVFHFRYGNAIFVARPLGGINVQAVFLSMALMQIIEAFWFDAF